LREELVLAEEVEGNEEAAKELLLAVKNDDNAEELMRLEELA